MMHTGLITDRKSILPGRWLSGFIIKTAPIAIGADTNLEPKDATTCGAFGSELTRLLTPLAQRKMEVVLLLARRTRYCDPFAPPSGSSAPTLCEDAERIL